jgi:membrane protein YdbS with pleckstrin-like domain
MDELFAPPSEHWRRLSPSYATVLRIRMLIVAVVVTATAASLVWLAFGPLWAIAVIGCAVVFLLWRWFRIARWVRAWGYAERGDDLYLSRGLWFKELTAVPYGRMQAVKVESGPLTRWKGLASVHLVTASLQSGATIPGLPQQEAERLRDRLTAIGIGDEASR